MCDKIQSLSPDELHTHTTSMILVSILQSIKQNIDIVYKCRPGRVARLLVRKKTFHLEVADSNSMLGATVFSVEMLF